MSLRSTAQRQSTLSSSNSSQSPLLQQRVQEKRAELESLKQLKDLSGGLVGQIEQLEQKLSTLTDGTEAVATVLSHWHNVLMAINLASTAIPVPKDGATMNEPVLPQKLVRVPIERLKPSSQIVE